MTKIYKKYLPNVEVDWFSGLYGPVLVNNMIARKVHMAYIGDVPAVVLASKKASVETNFVGLCQSDKGASIAILVRKDSTIQSVRDLDGKRVATGFGSFMHRFLEVVQTREKIKFDLVNQPPEVALTNLEAGRIDADGHPAPHFGVAVHKGTGRVLTTGSAYDFQLICGIVVNKEYASQHPKVIEGWLKAEAEVHEFIRSQPDKAAELIFEAWERKIPIEVIRRDLEGALYPDEITAEHVQTLKSASDFLFRNKLIDVQPDIESWVDTRYLRAGR